MIRTAAARAVVAVIAPTGPVGVVMA